MREKIDQDAIRREQAKLMCSNGLGYAKIIAATGLSKGVVRNFCTGLTEKEEAVGDQGLKCTFCGADIEQHTGAGRPRKFCSDYCRRQYWRLHRQEQRKNPKILFTKTCRYCGKSFEIYGKNDRKYCCRDHYLKHYFGDNNSTNPAA